MAAGRFAAVVVNVQHVAVEVTCVTKDASSAHRGYNDVVAVAVAAAAMVVDATVVRVGCSNVGILFTRTMFLAVLTEPRGLWSLVTSLLGVLVYVVVSACVDAAVVRVARRKALLGVLMCVMSFVCLVTLAEE